MNKQDPHQAQRFITESMDDLDFKLLQYGPALGLRQLNDMYQRLAYLMGNMELMIGTLQDQASLHERDELIGLHDLVIDAGDER